MNTTDALRSVFAEAASSAPSADALLPSIRRRAAHRRRARRGVSAALAVLVLVAGAMIMQVIHRSDPRLVRPTATVPLVAFDSPTFPYAPTWAAGRYRVFFGESGAVTAFGVDVTELDFTPNASGQPTTMVFLSAAEPQVHGHASAASVAGRPATYVTDVTDQVSDNLSADKGTDNPITAVTVLYWQTVPGEWLALSDGRFNSASMLAGLAEKLVPRPLPVVTTFDLDVIPEGMHVTANNDEALILSNGDTSASETVSVVDDGSPVTLGWSTPYPQMMTDSLITSDGQYIQVIISGPLRFDRTAFVAGIHEVTRGLVVPAR